MTRVLIVDDEKCIRLTLREFLREAGYQVGIAEDAAAAQQLLQSGEFDVVVSDIILPRVTGVELLKSIRLAAPDVQVIMMTGEPTVETATEAVRAGASDYLMKPISKQAFLRSVRHAGDIKNLDDEKRRLTEENLRYQKDLERRVEERTHELCEMNQRLQTTIEGTVQAIALTVESRDPYTAGHQQHVAELARALGKEMGLPEEQIKGIYMAGLIHDLGKISVPAEILNKPSRPTENEFALIRLHPQTGHNILKNISFPWPIAEITLQHHERLNGSGYPRGLSGNGILAEARILAVADVVEAMASHRPYRPALGLPRALDEIRKKKGTLYDDQAVEACLRVFQEGSAAHLSYLGSSSASLS